MSLSSICTNYFNSRTRNLGLDYFYEDRIEIEADSPEKIVATVMGSELYEVSLWSDKLGRASSSLGVACDCPHFSSGNYCKHIWATLKSVESQRTRFVSPSGKGAKVIRGLAEDQQIDLHYNRTDGSYSQISPDSLTINNKTPARPPQWQEAITGIGSRPAPSASRHSFSSYYGQKELKKPREVWYFLDVEASLATGYPIIDLQYREFKKNGDPGKFKPLGIGIHSLHKAGSSEKDKGLISFLLTSMCQSPEYQNRYYAYSNYDHPVIAVPSPEVWGYVFPQLCETGRFGWVGADGDFSSIPGANEESVSPQLIKWVDEEPWRLRLKVEKNSGGTAWGLFGYLFKGEREVELKVPTLLLSKGLVFFEDEVARLDAEQHFSWISTLRKEESLPEIPFEEQADFVETLFNVENLPDLKLPQELEWKQISIEPQPILTIDNYNLSDNKNLVADTSFAYQEKVLVAKSPARHIVNKENKQILSRDRVFEARAQETLLGLGLNVAPADHDWTIDRKIFPKIVQALLADGWQVRAGGKPIRQAGEFKGIVSSGIDWFELSAKLDFDGLLVDFPDLLEAVKEGQFFVTLGDGTTGLLPQEWLNKLSPLANLGKRNGEKVQYNRAQAMLLDALLEDRPEIEIDSVFAKLREQIKILKGVKPAREGKAFAGTLRDYQREGLGWLNFLQKFRFGGCLADDMGLGKTVQVLAMLSNAKAKRKTSERRPTLIVMPRSLIYNWIAETKRFTKLKILDYSTPDRSASHLDDYDIVITTYAIMRRDIADLQAHSFFYAILDEAQNIKNAQSQASKAAKLINSEFKLCMTGTPVENHLGELWSLFEFLNPGFLGGSSIGKFTAFTGHDTDDETIELLAKAVSPFILRRTKEQVLKDLPPKTEQTIFCELPPAQRKQYKALSNYYRARLDKKIKSDGLNKSKIQVLEALLRLRQVACHPGLVDKKQIGKPSAKTDALLEQLSEVVKSGHKALVFSQFTSMLSIVKKFLDKQGWTYEYLDGKTKDRQGKVNRFQTDKDCPIFLISLKAGGVGLNLTAADYCFILDPWWNPAVEAQAIDRAHRIGQTKKVFAYRFVAKDTVEEKILELQSQKRELANAIVTANGSLIRGMTKDDLGILLS
jgi:hypothetical protein